MADNKDKKVLNVPALRFPEFMEEWERIRVSDLLDFYSTNSLSWEQLEYESNEPYNLQYDKRHLTYFKEKTDKEKKHFSFFTV